MAKQVFKTIYSDAEFRQLIREELKAVLNGEENQVAGGGDEGYITLEQAKDFLKISKSKLYKLTMAKEVPFIKQGRRVLFKKSDLAKWVESK